MIDGYNEIIATTKPFIGSYIIVDHANIIRYVGSSRNIKKRIQDHISMLLRGNHDNEGLMKFYIQNGKRPFKYYAKEAVDREEAFDLEQAVLDFLMPKGILFNIASNARIHRFNVALSEEHKRAISNANRGIPKTPEHIAKVQASRGNYKHTEETKLKLSQSHKGKKQSESTILKRSKSMTGRKVSDETKLKLSMANTGKTHTFETRKRLSEVNKGNRNALGYKHTPEALEKMRQASTGKKQTRESIEKGIQKRKGFKMPRASIEKRLLTIKNRPLEEATAINQKISLSNSIPVSIDGVIYTGLREASSILGIGKRTIHQRCLSNNFANYFQIK